MKLRINENDINDTTSLKDVIKNAKRAAKKDGYSQDIFIDKNGEYGFVRHFPGNLSDWNGEQLIGQVQTNWDNGIFSVSYVDFN